MTADSGFPVSFIDDSNKATDLKQPMISDDVALNFLFKRGCNKCP